MGGSKNTHNMTFDAVAAVIFYALKERRENVISCYETEKQEQPLGHPSKLLAYATVHRIENGQYTAGKPVNSDFLAAMSSIIIPKADANSFFLHDRAVYFSYRTRQLVWWKPAGPQHILFAQNTGIKSGIAKLPPLLFCCFGASLRVFALKDDIKPNADTLLYRGPFFNDGCMGDVAMPSYIYPSDCTKIEDLFFTSEFTLNEGPVLDKISPIDLWTALIAKGTDFPMECLVPHKTLLAHIIEGREEHFGV